MNSRVKRKRKRMKQKTLLMLNDSIAISWDTVLPLIVPLIVLIQKSM